MRKSDTNANVLPPKSPWCSQWKLILNFPPPVPRGRGSPAASPFPDSQVVTLPAAAAGHRLSSERGCAGRRAPDSGTGHLHAPRGRARPPAAVWGFAVLGFSSPQHAGVSTKARKSPAHGPAPGQHPVPTEGLWLPGPCVKVSGVWTPGRPGGPGDGDTQSAVTGCPGLGDQKHPRARPVLRPPSASSVLSGLSLMSMSAAG